MKNNDIVEFKKVLQIFRTELASSKNEEPEYNEEVDRLLNAVIRVQQGFANINSMDELDFKTFEEIGPDFILVTESMAAIQALEEEDLELDLANSAENDEEEDEDERFIELQYNWFEKFYNSSQFKQLTESQQEDAESILVCFSDFVEELDILDPKTWEKEHIEEICLGLFPEKVPAEISLFHHVGPVLMAFFNFLSEKKLLKQAKEISDYLKTIQNEIPQIASDPHNWELEKVLAMKPDFE